ncbi:MAG: YceI family protein, partial [Propionibacteriaceae bacterium]|nr:YceI family protein [Propionibacteriaceae bacterium]
MSIFSRNTKAATEPSVASTAGAAVLDFDASTAASADITGDYTVDPTHSRIGFSARHAMVTTVRGSFAEFDGTAHLDVANPAQSSARLRIQVTSITTGQDQRDAHLRTSDFFDAEAYPEILFASTSVAQLDADVYAVTGDLTIKDVTRPVTVEFTLIGSAKDP